MVTGFVDLQINGYAGVDWNSDSLTIDELHHACSALQRDGVSEILATLITAQPETLLQRISKIVRFREQDQLIKSLITGLHIEGPFLNSSPGFIGAHPVDAACLANSTLTSRIIDSGAGLVKIFTLAPECDPNFAVTKLLANQNIIVSGGHSDATLEQLKGAIDNGLSMFTHLGNGCPMLQNRHDNITQRVLSLADQLSISLIADGAHVPYFALKNYLNLIGFDRAIIVSDAISAAGCGAGRFQLGERWVNVGDDGVPRAEDHSHLVGSGTSISKMAQNLSQHLGLNSEQISKLTVDNPHKLLQR